MYKFMNKALRILILASLISAQIGCLSQGGSSSPSARSIAPVEDSKDPTTEEPSTEEPDAADPVAWSQPTSIPEAEQEFRGEYYRYNSGIKDPSDKITIGSDFSIAMQGIQSTIQVFVGITFLRDDPYTCQDFSTTGLYGLAMFDRSGVNEFHFKFPQVLVGEPSESDCPNNSRTDYKIKVKFTSQKCILTHYRSTNESTYCKD